MPGMTPASGFPMMWAASGLPLPQLVERIIQTALRKRPGLRLAFARGAWRVRAWRVAAAGPQTAAGGVQGSPGCRPRPLRCCVSRVTSWASRR